MPPVYLALGTNLGDRRHNLAEAIKRLGECMRIDAVSSLYETEPWGVLDQPFFLNQVVVGYTQQDPFDLLACISAIQSEMGKKADGIRYGPRLIDIDILAYGSLTLLSYQLTIPHPRMVDRAFVLVPLAEINPEWIHPGNATNVRVLLGRIDSGGVVHYRP